MPASLLLIPDAGRYNDFEDALDLDEIDRIIASLKPQSTTLTLPYFSFTSGSTLNNIFAGLGITDAKVEGQADFSGVNKVDALYQNGDCYSAHISMSETGAQGAGSTVVTIEGKEELPEPLDGSYSEYGLTFVCVIPDLPIIKYIPTTIDVTIARPFIFIIRDTRSGIILFLGRVMNPES